MMLNVETNWLKNYTNSRKIKLVNRKHKSKNFQHNANVGVCVHVNLKIKCLLNHVPAKIVLVNVDAENNAHVENV